jgi:hypothetical protein
MKRLHSLTLAAALALLSVASYGQIPINSTPLTITSPGIYVLAKDLSAPGIAILIKSANVTIDFGGHLLTCTNTLGSTGVRTETARNVTIKNGTIDGFLYGIDFHNPSNDPSNNAGHVVENMRITILPSVAYSWSVRRGVRFRTITSTPSPRLNLMAFPRTQARVTRAYQSDSRATSSFAIRSFYERSRKPVPE